MVLENQLINDRWENVLQLGSDPHIILSNIAIYQPHRLHGVVGTAPYTNVPTQFLLDVQECCRKHMKVLDENYELHGQLERVKARYVYRAAREFVDSKVSLDNFLKQWPVKCYHNTIQYPFMLNGCVVFKSYCECKCATTVIPQLFLDQAKKEMEGDGLEWF